MITRPLRPSVVPVAVHALLLGCCACAGAPGITSHLSPRNAERPLRPRTDYIILHTTEGPKEGSLKKVHRYGETHYFVDQAGKVYRIIERNRIALHAGRSMWKARTNLDRYAIGIETVGYHNGSLTAAQYSALSQLIAELQRIYKVPDENVLTHSMIAYGAPNRWHRRSHRGRKRCGMLFAAQSVRQRLGLGAGPRFDPDVKAGRLTVGDPYLASVLYSGQGDRPSGAPRPAETGADVIAKGRSAWDIARDRYASADVVYTFPDGTTRRGNEIRNWGAIPVGTKVSIGGDSSENAVETVRTIAAGDDTAEDIAGDEVYSSTTIYFLPDGRVRRGDELEDELQKELPQNTRMLVGYVHGGTITARRSAFDICGKRWNFPSTFYRMADGSIVPGSSVNENAIPKNTMVFFRN